jgi:hypothetical protein
LIARIKGRCKAYFVQACFGQSAQLGFLFRIEGNRPMKRLKSSVLGLPFMKFYITWKRNRNIISHHKAEYRAWLENEEARLSVARLDTYRDKHKGERCFIIGNGPSLKQMDLSLLKNEISFGANRIYLLFDELGFTTSYYCSVNQNVIEQFADDIAALPMPKFLTWAGKDMLPFQDDMMFIRYIHEPSFHPTPQRGLWYGATVTYAAMQLAYYMGFQEVILIGVDHNFKDKGEAHKLVTSTGADENHFHPDYFGKGVKWQLPDLETSEHAYLCARQAFEADGRKILDATVGGKLTIFPKVDFTSLFDR